jgi:hypothetical protein
MDFLLISSSLSEKKAPFLYQNVSKGRLFLQRKDTRLPVAVRNKHGDRPYAKIFAFWPRAEIPAAILACSFTGVPTFRGTRGGAVG